MVSQIGILDSLVEQSVLGFFLAQNFANLPPISVQWHESVFFFWETQAKSAGTIAINAELNPYGGF